MPMRLSLVISILGVALVFLLIGIPILLLFFYGIRFLIKFIKKKTDEL